MWRSWLVSLALLLVTWLEFQYYPGHSYLGSSTQLYVPMLEHLQTPAYLTRDLVATHPLFAHTVYDELSLLLLRSGHMDLQQTLMAQQLVCRLAAVTGVFLLVRAMRANRWFAVLLSSLIGLGSYLPGLKTWLIDPEPAPRAFAFSLCILALGLLAKAHPLPSGLCAGIALLFDPIAAVPFWALVAALACLNSDSRRPLRPLLPVFLVFVLLLANLAQLQQGTPDSQATFERVSDEIAHIQQFRSPELWISKWPHGPLYFYLAVWVTTVWAVTRLLPSLPRVARWILLFIPSFAVVSFAVSFLLLDYLHWASVLRWRPLEWCAYAIVIALAALPAAAIRAFQMSAYREGAAWLAACLFIFAIGFSSRPRVIQQPGAGQLARWAGVGTWGSSMFAFPDAGQALYPGAFRAASLRAVWVDWEGGCEINNTVALAPIWWQRWRQTMTGPLSGDRLQQMLALPIDYYVFRAQDIVSTSLEGQTRPVPSVYANRDFRVFEANTLRLIPGRLVIRESGEHERLQGSQLPR